MRPEDYKPCAWSDDYTTQSYGDYPLLEYENAANRNAHYNWDNHHMRRNYGDPLHHDSMFLIGSYPNAKNPKYEQVYDYYLGINFYFAFLGFIAFMVWIDFYLAKEYRSELQIKKVFRIKNIFVLFLIWQFRLFFLNFV